MEYDVETLERIWQRFLKKYNEVLRGLGGNDFEEKHTGSRKRQQEDTLLMLVPVDQGAPKTALNWWIHGVE